MRFTEVQKRNGQAMQRWRRQCSYGLTSGHAPDRHGIAQHHPLALAKGDLCVTIAGNMKACEEQPGWLCNVVLARTGLRRCHMSRPQTLRKGPSCTRAFGSIMYVRSGTIVSEKWTARSLTYP